MTPFTLAAAIEARADRYRQQAGDVTIGTRVILSRAAPPVAVEEVDGNRFAYRITPTGPLIWCGVGEILEVCDE